MLDLYTHFFFSSSFSIVSLFFYYIWDLAAHDRIAQLICACGTTHATTKNESQRFFFFFFRGKENREKKKKEKEEEVWLCEWCNIHEPERWGVGCYPYLAIRGWVMILYFFLVEAKRMFYKWSLLLFPFIF